MVSFYVLAFSMPVEKAPAMGHREARGRSQGAVAALMRILDQDPQMYGYGWNVVRALAKGALVEKRLAEKLLLLHRNKAERNYQLTLYNIVLQIDIRPDGGRCTHPIDLESRLE